ncbi:MAG: metallophosphoesterase [Bacteroidales bacterium]|nr:metallophosphoesterase [Bacteroidales bacterium]
MLISNSIDNSAFFVSDLHGKTKRYELLFQKIKEELPRFVFLGGDLLPSGLFSFTSNDSALSEFLHQIIKQGFEKLKLELKDRYPMVFLILGNDDGKTEEKNFIRESRSGLWNYIHNKKVTFEDYSIYGYSYVPPSPFLLKDWERYDVSRYVCPNCIPIEEGVFSEPVDRKKIQFETISKDIKKLTKEDSMENAIFLFHCPPYKTYLDRAALDDKKIDHVPLDVHIGSIAIKRFIEEHQPMLTLHGHVHESASITGYWKQQIGKTIAVNAAHDKPELSLIRFQLQDPTNATRELIPL